MIKVTELVVNKRVNGNLFANVDTGEVMSSEVSGNSVVERIPTELVKVEYSKFTITNDEALNNIEDTLGSIYRGKVSKMATMVNDHSNTLKTEYNVPHNSDTLRKAMAYSPNKYYSFINKLIMKDIVHEVRRVVGNRIVKTIVLNPSIARRTSVIDKGLIDVFIDLSEGLPSLDVEQAKIKYLAHERLVNDKK